MREEREKERERKIIQTHTYIRTEHTQSSSLTITVFFEMPKLQIRKYVEREARKREEVIR